MAQLLTVSRAAQLVGVSRGVLQRKISAGELVSSDGLVATDELLRVFPQLRLEDSGAFEQTRRIRDEAFGRRVGERMLPSPEVLSQRLFAQSQELAELRRHLQAYHRLVADTLAMLEATPADATPGEATPGEASARAELVHHLERGLARVLASEASDPLDAMTDMLKVVSAHVSVRPSGREFLVEGNDSLLQAGLKSGLRFSYGCGGGNCGLCKARVVSGEARPVQHADYLLSAAERAQGYVLMCTHTAQSDLVLEALEAGGPADIPAQDIVARVRAVTPLGRDTRLLHLQTPRSDRLRFLAGQSVTLGVAATEGDVQHSYPLASCPCDDRNLLFHVVRDADDPFAAQVFADRLAAGSPVGVRGPLGEFVLRTGEGRPIAFLACDAGFAPIKSLVEHAIAAESSGPIALVWAATRADGHYLSKQCLAWAAALDEFEFQPVSAPAPGAAALRAVEAAAALPWFADCDLYAAGPSSFVEAAGALLRARGVAAARWFCTSTP